MGSFRDLLGTTKTSFKIGKALLDASGVSSAVSLVLQNKAGTVGLLPSVTSKSVDYTFVLADANNALLHPSSDATARTFTVPSNAAVPLPIGSFIDVFNGNGAGNVTIAITTDTLRLVGATSTGTLTLTANGKVRLYKVNATEWYAIDYYNCSAQIIFTPASLFGAGEAGAWWHVNDLTTMWQEANGQTVAAVGSPVGLLLDKRLGLALGAENITNGTFTGNATGWTLAVNGGGTVTYGANNVVYSAALQGECTQTGLTLTAGKLYKVVFTISGYTAGFVTPQFIGGTGAAVVGTSRSANGTYTEYLFATGNATLRILGAAGSTSLTIDDVSVKLLDGNHLSQATTSKKPILRQDATTLKYYLENDGVDDQLDMQSTTTFQVPNKTAVFAFRPAVTPPTGLTILFGNVNPDWYVGATNSGAYYASHYNAANTQKTSTLSASGSLANATTSVGAWTWTISGSNVTVLARNNKVDQTTVTAMPMTDGYTASTTAQQYSLGAYGAAGGFNFMAHRFGGAVIKMSMTTTERGNVETYLGAEMGITI